MKRWRLAIIAFIFFCVSLFVFWPILTNFNFAVLGNLKGYSADSFQNIWNLWWSNKTCLGFCGDIWHTNYMFYPEGISLVFQTFFLPILAIFLPLTKLGLGFVAAYNLGLLALVFLAMFSMFALVFYLTKNYTSAVFSGIAYGLSPFLMGHLLGGQTNLSAIFYFPLILLLTLKLVHEKEYLNSIFLGTVLALAGLSDFTYLIFSTFLVFFVIVFNRKLALQNFKKFALAFVVFFVPFVAFSYQNFANYNDFVLNDLVNRPGIGATIKLQIIFSPPPYTLLGSKYFMSAYGGTGSISERMIYIGIVLLAFAAFYLWKNRKGSGLYLSIFAFGFLFALGPEITVFGQKIPLPYALLSQIPFLNSFRFPNRFFLFCELGIIILAAFGLKEFLEAKKPKWPIVACIFALLFVDLFPISMPVFSFSKPKVYQYLENIKDDSALIEVPFYYSSGLKLTGYYGTYLDLYYQTFTNKKIASGYATRVEKSKPADLDSNLVKYVLFEQAHAYTKNVRIISASYQADVNRITRDYKENAKHPLDNNRFKYIVFKKPNPISPVDSSIESYIKAGLKNNLTLIIEDDVYELYEIKK